MTTNLFLRKKEVLLFCSHGEYESCCQLKNFIHCLNLFDKRRPLHFAYAEAETLMMNRLSLKENILLDGVLNSLCMTKEFQLERHLDKEGRPCLVELYNKIGNIDLLPDEATKEAKKLASLLKTLLRPSDYIFLESPELYLSQTNLDVFIAALQEQIEKTEQTIFIHSLNEEIWAPYASKKILKGNDGVIKVLLPSSFKSSNEKKAA